MENKTSNTSCLESNKINNGDMSLFDAKEIKKQGLPIQSTTHVDANSLRTGIKNHYIKKADDLMKMNMLETYCDVFIWVKHESVLPSLIDYWKEKNLVVKKYKGIFITQIDKKESNCIKIKLSWK